ncbi:hypothetical protein [Agromyces mariniharenae]|uniref:Uncharacterized protein n=1 Tax=Agromyces mariniharenae TaxID=2604423 RepID=A0A5S4V1F6_9MICO|nr:hypothetical protein [Agromyces mariniharenae]TYL52957.1 hypothetical protein FYC51_04305 [Agromyces mariniharenae]
MMHVTFADKSLLLGDDAALALLDYATALADHGRADQVTLRAIGNDGNEVDVRMVLDAGIIIAAETTNITVEPPENAFNIADIRRRLNRLVHRVAPAPTRSDGFPHDGDHWPEEY